MSAPFGWISGHGILMMIAQLEVDRKPAMRERAFPTIDPLGLATGVMPKLDQE